MLEPQEHHADSLFTRRLSLDALSLPPPYPAYLSVLLLSSKLVPKESSAFQLKALILSVASLGTRPGILGPLLVLSATLLATYSPGDFG